MLELDPAATFPEVRSKYHSLKALYSTNTIELNALNLDLSDDRIRALLEQLEEAYAKLTCYFESGDRSNGLGRDDMPCPIQTRELKAYVESVDTFTGPIMKEIRTRFGFTLLYMSDITRIGKRQLECIEAERFSIFEAEVYLKGYIVAYARCLSLDPARVAADYMERYRAWKESAAAVK